MKHTLHSSPVAALLAAVAIFVTCSIAAIALTAFVFADGISQSNYVALTACQGLTSILMFGLPALVSNKMALGSWMPTSENGTLTWRRVSLALSIIIMVQGLIQWASFVNEQMMYWPSMQGLNSYSANEENAALLAKILRFDTPLHWCATILVIGIVPAICEEFFFRGMLQHSLFRISGSNIASVIFASIIFSAMHLEASAFLPRFMLGCVLGTLFFVSKNIWVSVIAHATNNIGTVISLYVMSLDTPLEELLLAPTEDPGVLIPLLSLTLVFGAFRTLSMVVFIKK